MRRLSQKVVCFLVWPTLCVFAPRARSQSGLEETLSGPDSHETGQGHHGHLFGERSGKRTELLERGVRFDFQYISDSLWNLKIVQPERFASWNRFRGTVDIDCGLRFNEPLPVRFHNTMSFGYVRNSQSQQFVPPNAPPWKPENGFEFNSLIDIAPMLLLQPFIQYFVNVGGRTQHAVAFGFRTKVEV